VDLDLLMAAKWRHRSPYSPNESFRCFTTPD
jgi:hypothetical protein